MPNITELYEAIHETHHTVRNEGDVLLLRKASRDIAQQAGISTSLEISEVEIVVSELGLNAVKHGAVSPRIFLRIVDSTLSKGIEIEYRDSGPGIQDVSHAIRDGNSTAGTLGIGLPGAKRIMDEFTIESQAGLGTRIIARKIRPKQETTYLKTSVFSKGKLGENVSGDAYFLKNYAQYSMMVVVDALGHGPMANKAALACIEVIGNEYNQPLESIVHLAHNALKGTRGAAISLLRLNYHKNSIEHLSIGNVSTRFYGPIKDKQPFCTPGTLGYNVHTPRPMNYPYKKGSIIIMYSDGIQDRFTLTPNILIKPVQAIASYISTNFSRGYDDSTVLVAK